MSGGPLPGWMVEKTLVEVGPVGSHIVRAMMFVDREYYLRSILPAFQSYLYCTPATDIICCHALSKLEVMQIVPISEWYLPSHAFLDLQTCQPTRKVAYAPFSSTPF